MAEAEIEESGGHRCDASISAAFDVLGKRWNGVILSVLAEGDAGFADLRRSLSDAISDSMLSARLAELAELGLIERRVLEGPPVAVRYVLSESGRALIPVLHALGDWAGEHLKTPAMQ